MRWWEIPSEAQTAVAACPQAIAYYRHSAQDRQENSIPIQREQVRQWAKENGVEIIREFEDAGKSGLDPAVLDRHYANVAEGLRPAMEARRRYNDEREAG